MKKKRWRSKGKGGILFALGIAIFLGAGVPALPAAAAGETPAVTEDSQVMSAKESFAMKAEPDEDAKTLMTYEEGAAVFVTGETADGWYRIMYQDKTGYVKKEVLRAQEMDVEGLDAEMEANAEEAKFMVEAVERYRVDARRSKIWGSVIILLVAGIFAVGIISTLRSQKSGKEKSGKRNRSELEIQDLDLESK